MPRFAVALALIGIVLPPVAHARQASPSARSASIALDATVLDRAGRPVTDLAAADFEIELGGRAQPVRSATLVRAAQPMAGAVGPVFGAVTPGPPHYRLVIDVPADATPGAQLAVQVRVARADAALFSAESVTVPRTATGPSAASSAQQTAAPGSAPRAHSMGPVIVRDLRRWIVDSAGEQHPLMQDTIPANAIALLIVLELRAATEAPADLLVKISFARADMTDDPAAVERVIAPESRDGTFVAEAEFPLARVAAGGYVVRAAVLSGNKTLGSLSSAVKR